MGALLFPQIIHMPFRQPIRGTVARFYAALGIEFVGRE